LWSQKFQYALAEPNTQTVESRKKTYDNSSAFCRRRTQ